MQFFSGSTQTKLDDKGRFVLPSHFRYGLVESGELQFTIALGLGGCLTIYKRSDIERIVKKFQKKQHLSKYQPFFTAFFSTLHQTTCDRLGRTSLPVALKQAASIEKEVVIVGVLNKIEIWSKTAHEKNMLKLMQGEKFPAVMEEAFALLGEDECEEKKVSEQDLELIDTKH